MAKRARRTNKSCKRFSQRKPEPKAIGATISPAVKSRRAARKKKISRSSSLFIRRLSQASQMSMTMKTRPATIEGLKRQHQSVQKDCLKGKAEFQPGKPAVSQLLKARGKSTGNVVMTPKAILLCLAKIMPLGAMFTAIQILGSRDKIDWAKKHQSNSNTNENSDYNTDDSSSDADYDSSSDYSEDSQGDYNSEDY